MTPLQHDSAASLRVAWVEPNGRSGLNVAGWYVIRTCPCHRGETITMPFETRERAERAMQFLDSDARNVS